MQDYAGTNGTTIVISTTPGAAGISGGVLTIVNSGAFGVYPKLVKCFAGDTRNDTNLNAGRQGNKDAEVYLAYRTPDWIGGGDYRSAYTASVSIANSLIIDRSAHGDAIAALIVQGSSLSGMWAIDIFAGGTAGKAARFTGGSGSAGPAVEMFGATTAGPALYAEAMGTNEKAAVFVGKGTQPAAQFTAGGTAGAASVLCHNGPVLVDTNLALGSDPGANQLWANSITKAYVTIDTDGAGNVAATEGLNIDSVTLDGTNKIVVSFKRSMATADYAVTFGSVAATAGADFIICGVVPGSQVSGGFKFYVYAVVAASLVTVTTATVRIFVHVDGKMT